jgi:hypothetical protein
MKNYENTGLKIKIKYRSSDDVVIGDLLEVKSLLDEKGNVEKLQVTYFDKWSSEGIKTLCYQKADMIIHSKQILLWTQQSYLLFDNIKF